MSYQIVLTSHFRKQLKPLLKKYRGIDKSLVDAIKDFNSTGNTLVGTEIYKLRFTTRSLHRGKSGAFRLYVYVFEMDNQIVPITIYYKGDKENLTTGELEKHAEIILSELQQM
ncbi:MAG TPA: type II toxin-antitoxin system RelE/ParE family toxin [Candidatus Paceibacterota bacterium]